MKIISVFSRVMVWMILSILIQSCLSIARISEFPHSSSIIDFEKYAMEFDEHELPLRTRKTSYEYFLEVDNPLPEYKLVILITHALENKGYEVVRLDTITNSVLGKRGLRANEWKTVTGVYYNINSLIPKTQIYILSRITQDFTGGWKDNRAKKVATELENLISSAKLL